MTNTGDFRRYSYSSDTSYAIAAFNLNRSSAAPAYQQPRREKELKVRENPKRKSKNQLLQEQRLTFRSVMVIVIASFLVVGIFFGMLHSNVQNNELNHEISNLETRLSVAQSENTRINSKLNSLVSMSMIDQYAVNKLGMSKVQPQQIRYIDVSQYKEKAAAQVIIDKANK